MLLKHLGYRGGLPEWQGRPHRCSKAGMSRRYSNSPRDFCSFRSLRPTEFSIAGWEST